MWACYGLGSVPMGASLTLAACPLDGFFKLRFFFFLKEVIWLSAHKGCIGLCYLPIGDVLALAACLSHGGLAHGCCIEFGCVALPWVLPHEGCHAWQLVHRGYFGLGNVSTEATLALIACPLEGYFPK